MRRIMLDDLIKKHKMDAFAEKIHAAVQPCFVGSTSLEAAKLGDSKAGGLPHVPPGFEWPSFKEQPLEFVAQINCRDVPDSFLPPDGLLSFFYDNRHCGFSESERGYFRIFFWPQLDGLHIATAPQIVHKRMWGLLKTKPEPRIYRETKLNFKADFSLPELERAGIQTQDEAEADAFYEMRAELLGSRFVQMGGYPDPVQNDGIEEGISEILNCGPPSKWILVLEVSYDKNTDMMWGDAGSIYYFVHADDLKAHKFENAWLEMQCC